jgi:hypothetical protein
MPVKATIMPAPRNWFRYDFKIGDVIRHSGITKDLDRREAEHKQRWPSGRIVPAGPAVTEEVARQWEETKQKTITPDPKKK